MSFDDAAVELGISTRKLRQKMAMLQRELKAVLFDGGARSIALTEAGRIYRGQLAEIFADLRRVKGALSKQGTEGRLAIAACTTLGSLWLMPRLKQFERQWPHIHLALVPQSDRGWPAGNLQMMLSATPPKDHIVHLLARLELFPVCSPSLISTQPLNATGDLHHLTLLHWDCGEEWRKWLRVARGGPLDRYRSFKLSNASLAIQAAVQGHGVALASYITASHLLNAGKLLVPLKESVFSSSQMYITSGGALSESSTPECFVAWATEQVRLGSKHPAFTPFV